MINYKPAFSRMSEQLSNFIEAVAKGKLELMATQEWTIKEVLCHIVYWHECYAANYSSQVTKSFFACQNKCRLRINEELLH